MLVEIDFSKIRNYDGSQDNGFEELVCQLAHLSCPENADYFVRKEGAGGDAGVECYWKLKDGSEHAWQAKFFTGSLSENQWSQISKSVEAALNKHPQLTKYYVCLPRDWTDSRKQGAGGKIVNSAWDKWVEHVRKWKMLAQQKGMDVEFTYWCKHDISQMLQIDQPEYAGRALYWFNEPVVHHQMLMRIAEKSRESLGERFTPEFHLNLPIAKQLDGLGLTPDWTKLLDQQMHNLFNATDQVLNIISRNKLKDLQSCWKELEQSILSLGEELKISVLTNKFLERSEHLLNLCLTAINKVGLCRDILYRAREAKEGDQALEHDYSQYIRVLNKYSVQLDSLDGLLNSKAIKAAINKAAVLLGEAGIGKSHLLCDIALKRLSASLPTVFLLGQHYSGGNPLNFILDSLDLKGNSYHQVLGALDAAGEAKRTRTLIVIDAINEGHYRDEWYENISNFLLELSKYQNIAIIFSCRTTYKDYILPEIPENRLTSLNHVGFRGYEHRAAGIYLSKQGISKPSAPITSPEFSNPLFLKTCCKALKANDLTAFPKGMNGQSQLFNFYLDSVTKIINRKKRFRPYEEIVGDALNEFVQTIFPEHLSGIPVTKARKIINAFDPAPHRDEGLMDLLIDEGVLSLDIEPDKTRGSRGIEIVRFTYERFSDYFIAQHIISQYVSKDNLAASFLKEHLIGGMIEDGTIYKLGGVVEALGICFPEHFSREFIEFIPKESFNYNWLLQRTFTDGILWRSPDSFTEKSIDLLNEVAGNATEFHDDALNILLSLSTEPNHPWNADFLDRNLSRMSLAERDAVWSIPIAVSDQVEDEGQVESIVRTLLEWSLLVDVKDVELERLRLTSVALIWMTTTSNRKVRNQATKSLARILSEAHTLIPDLIKIYSSCNDPYLVERLYAACYGAVCNIKNDTVIKDIAELVYEKVFQDGQPYPHILLRDYARGIIELAYARGLLPANIMPNKFRPPYASEWPIENPTKEEIDELVGDEFSSSITRSVMGFPGDFGNYTMGCVHYWSSTPLSEPQSESALEVHRNFAKSLPHELKERYNSYLNKKSEGDSGQNFGLESILKKLKFLEQDAWQEEKEDEATEDFDEEVAEALELTGEMQDDWDELKKQIEAVLSKKELEYFRWVSGLGIHNRPATFSRKHAQRWVCKRVYELGWKPELFAEFERQYSHSYDRSQSNIERIGKKYQWIAFHEILARISDNLHWIDRGYVDIDDSCFKGPWQIDIRDVDPSVWQRNPDTKNSYSENQEAPTWWQPYMFPFVDGDVKDMEAWLWDENLIPEFCDLLKLSNPNNNTEWLVLRGFTVLKKKPLEKKNVIPVQNGWYRINSCIVKKEDTEKLIQIVKGKNLCDPYILKPASTGHQTFLKEYPWHPSCNHFADWRHAEDDYRGIVCVDHIVPSCEYEWEGEGENISTDSLNYVYLPTKILIDELDLSSLQDLNHFWVDKNGDIAFIDPSMQEVGPAYALIKSQLLKEWLNKNDLQLIWLVGGEKQLFTENVSEFYGRLVFSGVYTLIDDQIQGGTWFIKEQRDDE